MCVPCWGGDEEVPDNTVIMACHNVRVCVSCWGGARQHCHHGIPQCVYHAGGVPDSTVITASHNVFPQRPPKKIAHGVSNAQA